MTFVEFLQHGRHHISYSCEDIFTRLGEHRFIGHDLCVGKMGWIESSIDLFRKKSCVRRGWGQ